MSQFRKLNLPPIAQLDQHMAKYTTHPLTLNDAANLPANGGERVPTVSPTASCTAIKNEPI